MVALAASGELVSAQIGILGIAAFVLEGLFILIAGYYLAGKTGHGAATSGIIGALLGLVCATAGSAARWIIITSLPTDYAPSIAEAAGSMVVGAAHGSVFWIATGFVLGAIGGLSASRNG
jgi:hypothetical protein